jgi:hypothetical protein
VVVFGKQQTVHCKILNPTSTRLHCYTFINYGFCIFTIIYYYFIACVGFLEVIPYLVVPLQEKIISYHTFNKNCLLEKQVVRVEVDVIFFNYTTVNEQLMKLQVPWGGGCGKHLSSFKHLLSVF